MHGQTIPLDKADKGDRARGVTHRRKWLARRVGSTAVEQGLAMTTAPGTSQNTVLTSCAHSSAKYSMAMRRRRALHTSPLLAAIRRAGRA